MGLSIWHILLFLLVVVLLFGTSKLRNLGKDLGGALKDFKNTLNTDDSKVPSDSKNTDIYPSDKSSKK
ncbi:twin-arginine translocase TatA/TatE family subunit [Acinetobacter puyangensis]|uniref:twin-arginine translocase TatA/TatE family subunit n=1 Tax=Acinetobacter puyangensis TaxID=1096779 RepID=UPI003A4D55CF